MANQYPNTGSYQPLHILIADDLEVNQKIARLILQKAGRLIDLTENGQQALDICREYRYDFILMDLPMPIMDGYEATRQICELQLTAQSSKLIAPKKEDGDQSFVLSPQNCQLSP
jgi:CheY-like chemotaxis protein